jgi:hypothetical protein
MIGVTPMACKLGRGEHVAPVIVDVFRRYDAVPAGFLLAVLDAEEIAGAFE